MKKTLLAVSIAVLVHPLMAQSLADLFEKNKRSVVTIYVTENVSSGSGDPRSFTSNMGLGSGVLVKDDVVLSAAHVVGNAEEIMVQFYDGEAIPAKVERMSRVADVTLLRLDKPPVNPQVAVVGNSDETRIGDEIFVVGAPMGMPYSLSRGVISGRHSKKDISSDGKMTEYFQTDASINTGNSGGPMYNYRGELIGIVSFILTRSGGFEGIGFAATSQVAKDLLLSRSSKYFGVEALILPYELARILNVPQESGWLVQHVVKDSPAGVSGLKGGYRSVIIDEEEILLGGDIILKVDNINITGEASISELRHYLDNVDATVKHRFTVLREGKIKYLYWISSDIK